MSDLPTIPARKCSECDSLMTVPRNATVGHLNGYGFEVVQLPLRCTGRVRIADSSRVVNCGMTGVIHVGLKRD